MNEPLLVPLRFELRYLLAALVFGSGIDPKVRDTARTAQRCFVNLVSPDSYLDEPSASTAHQWHLRISSREEADLMIEFLAGCADITDWEAFTLLDQSVPGEAWLILRRIEDWKNASFAGGAA